MDNVKHSSRSTASNPSPELWGTIETARFLRCSITTLLRKAQACEIPATKVGRGWLFDPGRVKAWLDDRMAAAK